jgi:hypothetical protein
MLQKAVDSISEAQELRPHSAEAWSSLGSTYVMARRWKDAWIALNKAKRGDSRLARPHRLEIAKETLSHQDFGRAPLWNLDRRFCETTTTHSNFGSH